MITSSEPSPRVTDASPSSIPQPQSKGAVAAAAGGQGREGTTCSRGQQQRRRLVLFHPHDEEYLTELICLVRKQVEVFVEPPKRKEKKKAKRKTPSDAVDFGGSIDDGDSPSRRQTLYVEGKVGLRCVHCAPPPPPASAGTAEGGRTAETDTGGGGGGGGGGCCPAASSSARCAAVYPTSTSLVYQSIRNWMRYHMLSCPSVPSGVRERLAALKSAPRQRRSHSTASSYWEKSCGRIGLVNDAEGRLRLLRRVQEGAAEGAAAEAPWDPIDDGASRGISPRRSVDDAEGDGNEREAVVCAPKNVGHPGAGTVLPPQLSSSGESETGMPLVANFADGSSSRASAVEGGISSGSGGGDFIPALDIDLDDLRFGLGVDIDLDSNPDPDPRPDPLPSSCSQASEPVRVHLEADGIAEESIAAEMNTGLRLLSGRNGVSESPDADAEGTCSINSRLCYHGLNLDPSVDGKARIDLDINIDELDQLLVGGHECKEVQPAGKTSVGAESLAMAPEQLVNYSRTLHSVGAEMNESLSPIDACQLEEGRSAPPPSNGTSPAPDDGSGSLLPMITSGTTLPRDVLIERLQMACELVWAAGEIRPLAPQGNAFDRSDVEVDLKDDAVDLRTLGEELYEILMNERGHFVAEECRDGDDDDEPCLAPQRKKKVQGMTMGSGNGSGSCVGFVPLEALGIPPALCYLVMALLNATNNGVTEEMYGGYSNIKEVQEDLKSMVSRPERFLFPSSFSLVGATASDGSSELPRLSLDVLQNSLYGREEEMSTLLQAFDRAFATPAHNEVGPGNGVILVSGYSGTGKSSLVLKARDLYLERRRGTSAPHFISGKFDALRQVQPLSAITSALNDYCLLLANDSSDAEGGIDRVREALATHMGTEGWALADLIPNLGAILPRSAPDRPQPAVARVSGLEAQQRLEFLIRMLFRATCGSGSGGGGQSSRPVVLFLDDLQWANEQSLKLMTALATDSQQTGLVIILCYRANEVGPESAVMRHVDKLQRSGSVEVTSIHVDNLGLDSVNALISDAIRTLPRATWPLTRVVLNKTGGNAFFVKQLLRSLHDEGLLKYSLSKRRWEWDLEGIRNRDINGDVVELMTKKLLRLAPEVHESLRIAAAFGSHCQEGVLRIVDSDPSRPGNTVAALDVAVAEGLMIKAGDASYQFSHDQIQNAAYNLIPETERESFHLQIGRSLWRRSTAEQMERYLFILVDQLHRGASLVSDRLEKINLAELSLLAGQKSVQMSAFLPAWAYLKVGIGLTDDDDWLCHRDLCVNLHTLCAEMEYLHGDYDAMVDNLEVVLQRGKTLREKLHAYYILVMSSGTQKNLLDAFATAITVLGQLGESLSTNVSELQLQRELTKTHALLRTKTDADIIGLEEMANIEKRDAMKFCNCLLLYAFVGKKDFFPMLACRMVQLSLSWGVCAESAPGFASFGCVLTAVNDRACGYRMGNLALAMLDRFQGKVSLARVYCMVYGFSNTWVQPLQSCVEQLKYAIDTGLRCGDNEYAMGSANLYAGTGLASGVKLSTLMKVMAAYTEQMLKLNQQMAYTLALPIRQAIENLLGKSANPARLVGSELDERTLQRTVEEDGLSSMILFYELWLSYLFGDYEAAAEAAAKSRGSESEWRSRFPIAGNHVFYSGLTSLALARREGCGQYMDTIDRTMNQMKVWTSSSPWNCQHKMELMIAERAFLLGDMSAAAEAYDTAADTASKHRFVHEQGLALERAGIFFLENGDHAAASVRFAKAYDCYIQWEAFGKAEHLKERYTF